MSCKICGRGSCASWMHSAEQQEAWSLVESMDDRQLRSEVVDLRGEVVALKAEIADEAIALRDMMSERDAAEAALTKERARLDWLAESWDNPLAINLHPSYGWSAASKNIRAAIDAAMKEGNA